MQHNEVKKKDKRKIYTLLKLIGRTGSGRFVLFFFIVYMFQLLQLFQIGCLHAMLL